MFYLFKPNKNEIKKNNSTEIDISHNSSYGNKDYKEFEYEPNVDISYTYDYEKSQNRYKLTITFNKVPNNYIYYDPTYKHIDSSNDYYMIMIINNKISFFNYQYGEHKISHQNITLNKPVAIYRNSFYKVEEIMERIISLFKLINRDLNYKTDTPVNELSNFSYNIFLYDKKKKDSLNIQNLIELNMPFYETVKLIKTHRVKNIILSSNHGEDKTSISLNSFVNNYGVIEITNNLKGKKKLIPNKIKIIPLESDIGKKFNIKI